MPLFSFGLADREVHLEMKREVLKAGGSMPLPKFQEIFRKRHGFDPPLAIGTKAVMEAEAMPYALHYHDGIVQVF